MGSGKVIFKLAVVTLVGQLEFAKLTRGRSNLSSCSSVSPVNLSSGICPKRPEVAVTTGNNAGSQFRYFMVIVWRDMNFQPRKSINTLYERVPLALVSWPFDNAEKVNRSRSRSWYVDVCVERPARPLRNLRNPVLLTFKHRLASRSAVVSCQRSSDSEILMYSSGFCAKVF